MVSRANDRAVADRFREVLEHFKVFDGISTWTRTHFDLNGIDHPVMTDKKVYFFARAAITIKVEIGFFSVVNPTLQNFGDDKSFEKRTGIFVGSQSVWR